MRKAYNTVFYGLLSILVLFGVYLVGIRSGWFPSHEKITVVQDVGPNLVSSEWYIDFNGNIILVDQQITVLSDNLNSIIHEPKK